jgi:hypothetical protein
MMIERKVLMMVLNDNRLKKESEWLNEKLNEVLTRMRGEHLNQLLLKLIIEVELII